MPDGFNKNRPKKMKSQYKTDSYSLVGCRTELAQLQQISLGEQASIVVVQGRRRDGKVVEAGYFNEIVSLERLLSP